MRCHIYDRILCLCPDARPSCDILGMRLIIDIHSRLPPPQRCYLYTTRIYSIVNDVLLNVMFFFFFRKYISLLCCVKFFISCIYYIIYIYYVYNVYSHTLFILLYYTLHTLYVCNNVKKKENERNKINKINTSIRRDSNHSINNLICETLSYSKKVLENVITYQV